MDNESKISESFPKDPRIKLCYKVKDSSAFIRLKRVKWDTKSFVPSFKIEHNGKTKKIKTDNNNNSIPLRMSPFLLELSWKEKKVQKLPECKKDNKREKILRRESTDLENYLLRIHELLNEAHVERECKILLSHLVKEVSLRSYRDGASERNL